MTEAIQDVDFGFQDEVVRHIWGEAESLRGYCRGCPCHGQECLQAARKGLLFKCPNDAKSRIGPYIEAHLNLLYQRWDGLAGQIDPATFGRDRYYKDLKKCLIDLAGLTGFKFGFLHCMPWSIWKIIAPDLMAAVRNLHIAAMADPAPATSVHRVMHRFFKDGSDMDR